MPSRDTGVDLLVSDRNSRRAISLQVKFSKDFLVTSMRAEFQKNLRACGWWSINRAKLRSSPANFWVFVLLGFEGRSTEFIIIPPKQLLRRIESIHRSKSKMVQSYLWVTGRNECWETRGLGRKEQLQVAKGEYVDTHRDLTKWLNKWTPIEELNQ
ncbi:MAG: hypothetical protein ACRD5M_07775 [Candidatus Acidiferrales bacterium]